ncbi:hypothetical protein PRIPAC_86012 [Pristionchus pacificus]|uniref:Uncharacterized protein n=1 Tax=Pristionchus pacificus TaxID=54126 RepID=A0A2A6BTL2_PRIPA|nr:hypothetical protein PRIPAC_86012 [Pristionchus pacificus]|eukprot:PDM69146.1 hypothetical protein PRIPAC_47448 [Pristionchus pacificus]
MDSAHSTVVPSICWRDLRNIRCRYVRPLLLHKRGNDRAGGEAVAVSQFMFSRLKVWWFHLPVYIVTLAHFYPIYKSWISTENHSVTIFFSPMAIDPNERLFGKWLLMASSIIMFIEDLIFLVILLVKKSILQDSFKLRLLIPSFIILNHPIQHVFGRDKCADWSISDEFV